MTVRTVGQGSIYVLSKGLFTAFGELCHILHIYFLARLNNTMKYITALFMLVLTQITWALDMPPELRGQTVTVIVPYAAGGGSDVFSRMLAAKIKTQAGLNILVINRPGALATIGTREASEAQPTGLTLLGSDNAPVVMNPLMKTTGWVPRERFVAVAITVVTPQGIYVAADSRYNALGDLLADIKRRPNDFTYGCAYPMCRLFIERILAHNRTEIVGLSYKSTPQVQMDLSSGQLQFIGISSSDALAMTQAGKIKPLAFSTDRPVDLYPQAGLFKDVVQDFTASNFHGVYAPQGTPKHIVDYLNRVYRTALKDPELQEQFKARAVHSWDGSPEQAERYIDRQTAIWRPVVERYYKPD
jgi:tripartite-type tricarboxylate transporter receptor subunit TctC